MGSAGYRSPNRVVDVCLAAYEIWYLLLPAAPAEFCTELSSLCVTIMPETDQNYTVVPSNA